MNTNLASTAPRCGRATVRPRRQSGNVLLLSLMLTGTIGVSLASYLKFAGSQHRATLRSQSWNLALAAAEAGIEEAMTHLTHQAGKKLDQNNWKKVKGIKGTFAKTRTLGADSYFTAFIDDDMTPTQITSVGYFRAPLSTNYLSRTVQVNAVATNAVLTYALLSRKHVKCEHQGLIDSFDSENQAYSTNGQYLASLARDQARVGVSGPKDKGDIKIEKDAKLFGFAEAPAKGKIETKGNGSIGDKAWASKKKGIQPGHASYGLRMEFPEVKAPFTSGSAPQMNKNVGGKVYQYVLDGGNFYLPKLEMKNNPMLVTKHSVLFVNGDLKTEKDIIIRNGASLALYIAGGAEFKNKFDTQSKKASDFLIFGVGSSMNKLKIEKGSDLYAVIYAPRARIEIKGSGEVFGSIVGKCAHIRHDGAFHYDEALARSDKIATHLYLITSWKEI